MMELTDAQADLLQEVNRALTADQAGYRTTQTSYDVGLGRTVELPLTYVWNDAGMARVNAWLQGRKRFGFDLETSAIKHREGKIATMQIGYPYGDDRHAFVIDVRGVSREAFAEVFAALEDPGIIKLGQNIKFEANWMRFHYDVRLRGVADTQIAEMTLRAGLLNPKAFRKSGQKGDERGPYKHSSMDSLCMRYLKIKIDKDLKLRTSFFSTPQGQHDERQLKYAAGDTIYIYYIAEAQRPIIEERGLVNSLKVEFEFLPIVSNAEHIGMKFDMRKWMGLWQEAVNDRAKAERELDALVRPMCPQGDFFGMETRPINPKTNKPLNWDSPAQLNWAVKAYCERIKWPVQLLATELGVAHAKLMTADPEKLEYYAKMSMEDIDRFRRGEEKLTLRDEDLVEKLCWKVPHHVLAEDKYCVLLEADKNTLMLRMVRHQLPAELVKPLLQYSKHATRCDGFGKDFLDKHIDKLTARLHTEFHQCIADTGRMSSSPNVQNLPRDERYRNCWIAPEGKRLIIADLSQIEPRISAVESGDPVYTEAFMTHDDLYLKVAEAMFGFRPDIHAEDVGVRTEAKRYRQIAKVIVLGLAYRLGVWKLRDQLTIALWDQILAGAVPAPSYEYTKELYDNFFKNCSGIRKYQDRCSMLADPRPKQRNEETGAMEPAKPRVIWDDHIGAPVTYIASACGRLRMFPPDAISTYTEGPNHPIQGLSGTILKLGAIYFNKEVEKRGWVGRADLLNFIHDELVAEIDTEIAEEGAQLLKECMERAGRKFLGQVPCIAEFPEKTNGVVAAWTKGG